MTQWKGLTPSTATADAILAAGKLHGIDNDERCDLSDLLHGVPRSVLDEMLDKDEHLALFLMSGSTMPTTTMIEIYNDHHGMMKPAEVKRIHEAYDAQIEVYRKQLDEDQDRLAEAVDKAAALEDHLRAAEQEVITLKARLYDLLVAGKEGDTR